MVIKIQVSVKANGNKGSSSALANYLEKEDLQNEKEAFQKGELPSPRTGFFSHENKRLTKNEVINSIDANKKGLSKNDSKFYAINIAPSQKEQKHILQNIAGKDIYSVAELSKNELKQYENFLTDYSRKTMNEYASHFKRDNIKHGGQLLYFGKIEHNRNYKGNDDQVIKGNAKSGEKKPGLNSHIHIIVSRKDINMKIKLSPLTQDKGKSKKCITNGVATQRGFDRNLFNIKAENLFDKQFNYKRELFENTEYRIEASKNSILKTKIDLEQNIREKELLQKKLIENYNIRNEYTEKDKQLSQDIQPLQDKTNDKDLTL